MIEFILTVLGFLAGAVFGFILAEARWKNEVESLHRKLDQATRAAEREVLKDVIAFLPETED